VSVYTTDDGTLKISDVSVFDTAPNAEGVRQFQPRVASTLGFNAATNETL
jgi:hypothetical protein